MKPRIDLIVFQATDCLKVEAILEKYFPGRHYEDYSFPAEDIFKLIRKRRLGSIVIDQVDEPHKAISISLEEAE